MIIDEEDDELYHYGIRRRSGRYPYGSGDGADSAYERASTHLSMALQLKKDGLTETEVAKALGLESTTELRALTSIAKNQKKQYDISEAEKLSAKGMSNVAIGRQMGINESVVRSLLEPGARERSDRLTTISNMLRDEVNEKGYIDVGSGNENYLGISKDKLNVALAMLKEEGYVVHSVQVDTGIRGQKTLSKVLAPPGTTYRDIASDPTKIQFIQRFSEDGGKTSLGLVDPLSVNPDRVAIRYKEQGGDKEDGVIFVRPGVDDISLGGSTYAQVRIKIGDGHYLKGMAMYKDDLPAGVDLMFNTNKSSTGNKLDAMKPLKVDKDTGKVDTDNPFGSSIRRQLIERGADGKDRTTSAMNIVNEEGNWDTWRSSLSSQVLSKQSPALAKAQLNMTFERRRQEFEDIMALTNPSVRKKLLESFADGTDSSAIHLDAAAMPRQETKVILPMNSLKQNEIYAPTFKHGEVVALIRYPHGGKFEIPELVVNNNNRTARKSLGTEIRDAVGIHSKTAERLSGADFDGDTVLVIPNSPSNKNRLKTEPALESLKGFNPQEEYRAYEGMPRMSSKTKGLKMGDVSNLITDMTIGGATNAELARAVRHSMVVIDAEKHHLDYKRSAQDHGIPALKEKYQGSKRAGAATLVSRATSPVRVDDAPLRKASKGGPVDKVTGRLVYDEPKSFVAKDGTLVVKKRDSVKLRETDDARTLIGDRNTVIEKVYADHSNKLKDLANEARKEAVNTKLPAQNPSARRAYAKEVQSLKDKYEAAMRNRPLERQAQVAANRVVEAKKEQRPDMTPEDLKKVRGQALLAARNRVGATKSQIEITPAEWAAIQAGAVSASRLSDILNKANIETVKELATPRTQVLMTSAKSARAKLMLSSGYTQSEVADALGVSLTTLKNTIYEGGSE